MLYFNSYIGKILAVELCPIKVMSCEAKFLISSCLDHLIFRLVNESLNIIFSQTSRKTLEPKDIKVAISTQFIVFLPELEPIFEYCENAILMSKNSYKEDEKKSPISRQKRANIILPITKIQNLLKEVSICNRISNKSGIFMAAFLNYLCSYLCKKSSKNALESGKKRIDKDIILKVINEDKILKMIFKDCYLI